jgi:hypothetical protein
MVHIITNAYFSSAFISFDSSFILKSSFGADQNYIVNVKLPDLE